MWIFCGFPNFDLGLLTPSIEKIETNEVDEAIYSDLATKYDIRNATFEEFSEIANALYEAGAK